MEEDVTLGRNSESNAKDLDKHSDTCVLEKYEEKDFAKRYFSNVTKIGTKEKN